MGPGLTGSEAGFLFPKSLLSGSTPAQTRLQILVEDRGRKTHLGVQARKLTYEEEGVGWLEEPRLHFLALYLRASTGNLRPGKLMMCEPQAGLPGC